MSGCLVLAKNEYIHWHDDDCRIVPHKICKEYKIDVADRWYEHDSPAVTVKEGITILWNQQVVTDTVGRRLSERLNGPTNYYYLKKPQCEVTNRAQACVLNGRASRTDGAATAAAILTAHWRHSPLPSYRFRLPPDFHCFCVSLCCLLCIYKVVLLCCVLLIRINKNNEHQ